MKIDNMGGISHSATVCKFLEFQLFHVPILIKLSAKAVFMQTFCGKVTYQVVEIRDNYL